MLNNYFAISLIVVLSLSGCAANQSLQNMKQTKAAYEACLAANPKDSAIACKREKETYEAAGEDYESMQPWHN